MWVEAALVVPVVTSEVTGMGRQVPKSRMVREEDMAAFPLCSPKISTPCAHDAAHMFLADIYPSLLPNAKRAFWVLGCVG